MLLSLLTDKTYTTLCLPERCEGHYELCDPESGAALFSVMGDGAAWWLNPCGNNRILEGTPVALADNMLLHVRIRENAQQALLYAEKSGPRYAKYARCLMPDNVELTVGYAPGCQLPCTNQRFSVRHCKLICRGRHWTAQDLDSELGTFVNGRRIGKQPQPLAPGDVVSVLNQKFITLPGLLAINAQSIKVDAIQRTMHGLHVPEKPMTAPLTDEREPVFFHRTMCFTSDIESEDFNITAPPNPTIQKDQSSALLTYGPAMTSGLGMLLGGMNPFAGIGMMAGTLIWPQLSKKRNQKLMKEEEEKRQAQYAEYLRRMEKEMGDMLVRQGDRLRKRTPPAREELGGLLHNNRSLWNRRREHPDFLSLRLGVGTIPAKASISFPEENTGDVEDPMRHHLRELAARPWKLENVPMLLELSNFYNVGISGPRSLREALALSIVMQLACHVGYDDLKLCLLGRLSETLEPLRWLPHTRDDMETAHYIAGNGEEVDRLIPALDALLADHRMKSGNSGEGSQEEIVFLITDEALANSGLIRRLLFAKDYEHTHVISLAEHSVNLPTHANSVIIGIREHHGRMKWQNGAQSCLIDFTPDAPVNDIADSIASMLANTRLDLRVESRTMPGIVPFMDMFNVSDAAHLNLLSRWESADPVRTLRAPIGVSEDGNLCTLDLHEKGDGPHGLIAGTTGSGKSELIMSYILSMAICYNPEEVAFVLIDYKGGGMAQAFETLPHTAGIITNLDGNEINRSLMSIESELQRRQRVFSDTEKALGCHKLDIYAYQRFYIEGKVREPMPHLIVITDEFAELKTQQPEFLSQLIRAARIGRSLGVHLILATQKPAGVVDDQIWSNSNFRLCLRVQSASDSQDMLKCPDAAMLTNVGSFYKQVGYGEIMQKVQSAWTGAPYMPKSAARPDCAVEVVAADGSTIRREELTEDRHDSDIGIQLEAVTDYISRIAGRENRRVKPLWQPVLEQTIPLRELRERYGATDAPWMLNPVVGEVDEPANQRRTLLRLPVSEGKNTIVYGGIGSGKLMLLTTMMEDLLRTHTAEDLNVYILDYADDGLSLMRRAPQVGDVLLSDDDEKFVRLINQLQEAVASRKKLLGGSMDNRSLSERLQQAGLPNILVVLHHLLSIQQRQDDSIGALAQLFGEGPRYGIYFIATEESSNGLRFQLQNGFARKLVLQMNQEDDYAVLLGRTGGFKPAAFQGRGLFRDEGLYEFQTATVDEDIGVLCERLEAAWSGSGAEPIRILPEQIEVETLLPFIDRERPLNIPVALDISTIRPVRYPFDQRMLHLVSGQEWDTAAFLAGLLPLFVATGVRVTALDPNEVTAGIGDVECISANSLEGAVDEMWDFCVSIKEKMIAGESLDEIPRPRRLFVLPSPAMAFDRLTDNGAAGLRMMLEACKEEWNWTFLVCGTDQELSQMRFSDSEKWFKRSANTSEGILLGSASGQMLFQMNGNTQELYQKIVYPQGYVVRNAAPVRVQFVDGRR